MIYLWSAIVILAGGVLLARVWDATKPPCQCQGELRLTAIRCIGCRGVFCVPDSLLSNVRACPLCRGELLRFSPEPGENILDEFVEVADPADDQEGDA